MSSHAFTCPEAINLFGLASLIIYGILLYQVIWERYKLDRTLVKGRLLLIRCTAIILLTPFLLTILFKHPKFVEYPQEMVYDTDLYCENNTCKTFNSYDSLNAYNSRHDSLSETKIKNKQECPSVFWTVYYHFIDPGNQHMTTTEHGREAASLIAILGVFLLNGLLVSIIVGSFENRKNAWINGTVRYRRWNFGKKKFAVVIGANSSTPSIIKELLDGKGEKKIKLVVLLTEADAEETRKLIDSHLDNRDRKRLIVYHGQLDTFEEIKKLHLEKASEIYVLGETCQCGEAEDYHDIQNMKCVHNIALYLSSTPQKGTEIKEKKICRVMFEYQTTYSIFQANDISKEIKEQLNFIPFSAYENWARQVIVEGKYEEEGKKINLPSTAKAQKFASILDNPFRLGRKGETRIFKYPPIEGEDGLNKESKKYVHFIVMDMSKMGVVMAQMVAHTAHYPNFHPGENALRTRITFIDSHADVEKEFFKGRFQNMFNLARHRYIDASKENLLNKEWTDPLKDENSPYHHLCRIEKDENVKEAYDEGNFLDIEWEFVKGTVEQDGIKTLLKEAAKAAANGQSVLNIAICDHSASKAIAKAIYLPDEVYSAAQQILVYQRESAETIYNLSQEGKDIDKNKYAKLQPFGMEEAIFTTDNTNDIQAQLCNYVYSKGLDKNITEFDGYEDKIEEEWSKLTMSKKFSNLYLADHFKTKLRCIGEKAPTDSNECEKIEERISKHLEELAICEHNRWNIEKLLVGFRAIKENEQKEIKNGSKKIKDFKEGIEKAHQDICSFDKLKQIDPNSLPYDERFIRHIPHILWYTEKKKISPDKNKQ